MDDPMDASAGESGNAGGGDNDGFALAPSSSSSSVAVTDDLAHPRSASAAAVTSGSSGSSFKSNDPASTPFVGSRLPCFVFPKSLNFSNKSADSLRQLISIYNPSEFDLHYAIKTTEPSRYHVIRPKGSLGHRQAIDIPVTYRGPLNEPQQDRFRVEITGERGKGKKVMQSSYSPHTVTFVPNGVGWVSLTLVMILAFLLMYLFAPWQDWWQSWVMFVVGMLVVQLMLSFPEKTGSAHASSGERS